MAIMKAISILPESVESIAAGTKTEELRTWSTPYRGDIVICGTATKSNKGAAYLVAELYDCIKEEDAYAFKLRRIRAIKPFVVRGKQRIFDLEVPDNIEFYKPNTVFMSVDEEFEFIKACCKKTFTEEEIVELKADIKAGMAKRQAPTQNKNKDMWRFFLGV